MGSIAPLDELANEITVTGAVLGDYAEVTSSLDVGDLTLSAQVTADDTVTVSLSNRKASGSVDVGSPTMYVRVLSRSAMHQADV
jgi:hypothetical protein